MRLKVEVYDVGLVVPWFKGHEIQVAMSQIQIIACHGPLNRRFPSSPIIHTKTHIGCPTMGYDKMIYPTIVAMETMTIMDTGGKPICKYQNNSTWPDIKWSWVIIDLSWPIRPGTSWDILGASGSLGPVLQITSRLGLWSWLRQPCRAARHASCLAAFNSVTTRCALSSRKAPKKRSYWAKAATADVLPNALVMSVPIGSPYRPLWWSKLSKTPKT